MSNIEKTLSIIKPDAVERNLEDDIKKMVAACAFSWWMSRQASFVQHIGTSNGLNNPACKNTRK